MARNIDADIKEYFNTTWNFIDFFYAYCEECGYDDPENDLDDETYAQFESECEKALTYGLLTGLREVVIEKTNEQIRYIMRDMARENGHE